jgi:hypothetical protein
LRLALSPWGFHLVGKAGFKMGALMKAEVTRERYQAQTEQVARSLFEAIYRRTYAHPSFSALMVFRIQQLSWQRVAREESLDYQYWKNQGWFDPGCTFYIPHEASALKVGLARLTGSLLRRFVA